jgi:hypothetical protein
MQKGHQVSWTWAQCASNQQISIAILIKGKLNLQKKFKLMGDPWAQPAHKQAQSGHEYVNPTYVGQAQ